MRIKNTTIDLTEEQVEAIVKLSKEISLPIFVGRGVPEIRQIIYHDPATIVYWSDKTKTVVKCTENDTFSPATGLALCIMKKVYGDKEYRKILKEHLPHEDD